jgi:hypothetical protein
MANKFLNTGGSGSGDITNGTINVFAATLAADNLESSLPLKTNSVKQLISTNLSISDTNGLQTQLDSKINTPYNGTLAATNFDTSVQGPTGKLTTSYVADNTDVSKINLSPTTIDLVATNVLANGTTIGDFLADGSVPLTGDVQNLRTNDAYIQLGFNATADINASVAVGNNTNTGPFSTAVGYNINGAGVNSGQVMVGSSVASAGACGKNVVAIGAGSCLRGCGGDVVAIGEGAGSGAITSPIGLGCTLLGKSAGSLAATDNSIILRSLAGTNGDTVSEVGEVKIDSGTHYLHMSTGGGLEYNGSGVAIGDLNDYLPLAGGSMTGAIEMSTNKITGLGDPTLTQDGATKNYVDTQSTNANYLLKSGGTMTGNITTLRTDDSDVALGSGAKVGDNSVNIGNSSGTTAIATSVCIGNLAGINQTGGSTNNISIGSSSDPRGPYNICIGASASSLGVGSDNIVIGRLAGLTSNLLDRSICVGGNSGRSNGGATSTYIGDCAGFDGGNFANCLMLNAGGNQLNPTVANQMKISTGASGCTVTGDATSITFNKDITGTVNNTQDLGSDEIKWKDAYVNGSVNIGTSGAAITATVGVVAVNKILIGATDNTYDLGSDETKWKDLYVDGSVNIGSSGAAITATSGVVAVNKILIGATDNTYDLGSDETKWKDLYLDGIAYVDNITTQPAGTTLQVNTIGGIEVSTSGSTYGKVNYGRFSQTADLTVSTGGSQPIMGSGVGSKVFSSGYVGACGCFKVGGTYTCLNNNDISFQIMGGTLGTTTLFDSGAISSPGASTANFWEVEVEFTVRALGGAGVASIMINGNFNYIDDNAQFEGGSITGLTNASLDLTIDNLFGLNVTLIDSASQSITSTIGISHKLY